MEKLTFRYTGTDTSPECEISAGGQVLRMWPLYWQDCLGLLARDTAYLMRYAGEDQFHFVWYEEIARYHWSLVRRADRVHIRITSPTVQRLHTQEEILFEAECPLLRFASQIKSAMHGLLPCQGTQGFTVSDLELLTTTIEEYKRAL